MVAVDYGVRNHLIWHGWLEGMVPATILLHVDNAGSGALTHTAAYHYDSQGRMVEGSLLSREAYTTYAAEEVVERLAQGFGLLLDRQTIPNGAAPSHPGKTVYVFRPVKIPAVG